MKERTNSKEIEKIGLTRKPFPKHWIMELSEIFKNKVNIKATLDNIDAEIADIESKKAEDRTREEHLFLLHEKYKGSVKDYLESFGPFP